MMVAIRLQTQKDCTKLQQILFSALAAELQEAALSTSESETIRACLEHKTAGLAKVLEQCAVETERLAEDKTEDTQKRLQQEALLSEESSILKIQGQADAALQRVLQKRKEAPQKLATILSDCLAASRPAVLTSMSNNEGAAENPAELSPQPGSLQLLLSTAADKLPALRAKLAEALDRLQRVVKALDADTEMVLPSIAGDDMFKKQVARSLHNSAA